MLDHLICDCDGVLVDSEVIADRVLLRVLGAAFPSIDFAADAAAAFGQRTSLCLASLEARHSITLPGNFVATVDQAAEAELARARRSPACAKRLLRVPLPAAVVSNARAPRSSAPP